MSSGQTIDFDVSNAVTYRSEEFDAVRWLDLFTEPGGWTIETTPHVRVTELPSRDTISFVSHWEEVDASSWNEQRFLKSAALLRASDATDQLADWNA